MKAINRLGIDAEAVLIREQAGSGRNAVVTYKPGPMLRAAKEVA